MTISEEISLIDDYLLGRRSNVWPLPEVDEAISVMRVLDAIERSLKTSRVEAVIY